jgi:hypothetical protein
MDRMEDNRDHKRQKNRGEKGPGDEVTEIKRNYGKSEQEPGGSRRFAFHLRPLLSPGSAERAMR